MICREAPKKSRRRKLFNPNKNWSDDEESVQPDGESRTKSTDQRDISDEVKLKIPIPYFKSLAHKLFDSKSFDSPEPKRTPRKKLGTKVEEKTFKTPRSLRKGSQIIDEGAPGNFSPLFLIITRLNFPFFIAETSQTYSFLKSLDGKSCRNLCCGKT